VAEDVAEIGSQCRGREERCKSRLAQDRF